MNGSELKDTASNSCRCWKGMCYTKQRPVLLVAVSDSMETRCWKILTANKMALPSFIYIVHYHNYNILTWCYEQNVFLMIMFLIIYDHNFLFAFCYFLICVAYFFHLNCIILQYCIL